MWYNRYGGAGHAPAGPPEEGRTVLDKRRVTITDIAKKSGHSVGTVSKALKGRRGVSPETRREIMRAAEEEGYIVNAQASALRSGRSRTVAVIVTDIANPLFAILIKLCIAALERRGYRAIVMATEENAEQEVQAVFAAIRQNVDGVLLCPTQKSREGLSLLRRNRVPFVLLGRRFHDDDEMDYVVCDDCQGGYLAGRHLTELGHRRVLIVVPNDDISSAQERLEGFSRAFREAGLSLDEKWILRSEATGQGIGRRVLRALEERPGLTAIFSFSDYITWEIIYALNGAGLSVPGDISIVSFDNVQSRLCFPPPLTTMHYPKREIAEKSVELLLERISDAGRAWAHVVYESHIVVRDTTAPLDAPSKA